MSKEEMLKRMEELEKMFADPMFDDMSEEGYALQNEYDELFILSETYGG